ncbi:MAG: glycine cleavage system aminomethyltransferase GcvT [Candidatus Omnitrophica bacterium]|nr:glycine cleavage system aminomethyltransferase GcvT [Candidatus Omnitrophota bacterium]
MQKTALYERHRQLGAKMTDFHGWEMPLYYTSILEEHKAVREALGLFDISHMGQVLVTGPDAVTTLNHLVVSDMTQVGKERACYTLMLNERGGIVDDLILYRLGEAEWLVIVNCATHAADVEWLTGHAQGGTTVADISEGRAILAVQGPRASRVLEEILDAKVAGLGRFAIAPIRTMGPDACIARTGYTGGAGFELFVPNAHAKRVWDAVLTMAKPLGALPIGLGARDTLRVEAGLRLYGTDMDAQTSPIEAGLDWTVAWNKTAFLGREALLRQQREGVARKFVGFEMSQGPVPRAGLELAAVSGKAAGLKVGAVTSGTYSPILNKPLGMGYVEPAYAAVGTPLAMTVRNQRHTGTVVKLPFWKGERTQPALTSGAPTVERLT